MTQRPENYLSDLEEHSPQLFGAVSRAFPGEDANERILLAELFSFALKRGGFLEIDFQRESGVSYNPRPARVALILLRELSTPQFEPLAIALWFSAETTAERQINIGAFSSDLHALLGDTTLEIPTKNLLPAWKAIPSSHQASILEACALAHSGLFLDRLRHLHQADIRRLREVLPALLNEFPIYEALCDHFLPPLADKLRHWKERVSPKLIQLVSTANSP